ncbi:MAG: hypothetical protein WCV88_01170 [Patescibacteria group bacterium]|jgi:hypothetical protein
MIQTKLALLITFAASTLLLVGSSCTTTQKTNTNTINDNVNTEAVTNTNDNVSNDNTNVEQVSGIDTSDWQTYTNDEYGFSFKYPKEWGSVQVSIGDTVPFLLTINFRDENNFKQDIIGNPRLVISSNSLETINASDANSWFDYTKVDFTKTNDQLAQDLHRNLTNTMTVEKITIGTKPALKVTEDISDFDGSKINTLHILIPNYNDKQNNLTISGDVSISDDLLQVADSLTF